MRDVGIAMELVPSALAVDPGRLCSMKVHLTNDGPDARDVAVELPSEDRDWSWVHPEFCSVTPGEEAVVDVFFKPRCGPHPTAGTHTVDIVARAAGDATVAAQGRGTVDVGTYVDAAGHLDPMVAYDHMASSYRFHLENRGNIPVTAELCTEDPSGALHVAVEPARLSAGPGETATATVSVQARKKLKRGEHTYRVCVLAQVEGGSDLRIEGAFRQQGAKPAKVR
ncbi:MAG: hypothetical protein AVDCRST_MAG10-910 [uncultured Acidimicrobiales bacterium]|uniref:Alpha-galactosidase NEW3 domain-containing protein n=1 Tax=uncultured Acidimicrobiales bacterium TaxID=310071 RepID=A0A6J4HMU3_9ACTN|nr:MAG: hypothetical protein AVDCRST_MAG10-910 [uncultured Acidimicrobiales bacterium]